MGTRKLLKIIFYNLIIGLALMVCITIFCRANNHMYGIWVTGFAILAFFLIDLILFSKPILNLFSNYEEISHNLHISNIVYDLIVRTADTKSRDELYHLILDSAIESLPDAHKGTLVELADEGKLVFVANRGFNDRLIFNTKIPLRANYLYLETDGKMDRTIIIKDSCKYNELNKDAIEQEFIEMQEMKTINTTMCTPIYVEGKLWGILNIDSEKRDAFSRQDVKMLELFSKEMSKILRLYNTIEYNQFLIDYDFLTKTLNRRSFYKYFEELELNRKEKENIAIASIDLNNLKLMNDRYGHNYGDALIVTFVNHLSRFLGSGDLLSRFGGDEFILAYHCRSRKQAGDCFGEIKKYFDEHPITIEEVTIHISYSYGFSMYPLDGTDIDQLIRKADSKMYKQKGSTKKVSTRKTVEYPKESLKIQGS